MRPTPRLLPRLGGEWPRRLPYIRNDHQIFTLSNISSIIGRNLRGRQTPTHSTVEDAAILCLNRTQ
jgi:hypothetical protein